jgi:TRAP transporter TAXI family solute receptor
MRARVLGVLLSMAAASSGQATAQSQSPAPGNEHAEPAAALEPGLGKAPEKPWATATAAAPVVVDPKILKANSWTIGLASGLPEGNFMRFGAEIARNLNDGGDGLRVMPIITDGATHNVTDLLYLKGVDVALTNADVLEHFRSVERMSNIERRIQYVTGMYVTHLHLLVRSDIASVKDLEGKKVSFHTPGAGTTVSAPILFQRLGIKVEPVYVNNAIAMEMMKTGELAGLVNSGGKPLDLFTKFKNDYGYRFLPIPFDRFDDLYVPSVLSSDDYPGYIAPGERIDTLGVPVVLAVYNWPEGTDRARRIQRFVERLFDGFEAFQTPPYHPAWKSINLAAKVPGWVRYRAAEEKLAKMGAVARAHGGSK